MTQSGMGLAVISLTLAACVAMTTGGRIYEEDPAENKLEPSFHGAEYLDSNHAQNSGDLPVYSWLKFLSQQHRPQKRYSDLGMPYFRYQNAGKRNPNGVWIWMPAQGYVSVPHQQQGLVGADGAENSGKVMRYGR